MRSWPVGNRKTGWYKEVVSGQWSVVSEDLDAAVVARCMQRSRSPKDSRGKSHLGAEEHFHTKIAKGKMLDPGFYMQKLDSCVGIEATAAPAEGNVSNKTRSDKSCR